MHLPDPWKTLEAYPEIRLVWHRTGEKGFYIFGHQIISLRHGMTEAETRSTLRHEIEHHIRGRFLKAHADAEELACELAAARDLIPLEPLSAAIAWSRNPHEIAEELRVDRALLDVRLAHMTPRERAYLDRKIPFPDVA